MIENYLARLAAAGGSIDATGLTAVTALYQALARTGVWDRLGDVWPCVGANLTSCLVKLKVWPGSPSSYSSVGFVGGDYAQTGGSGGLTGDGATKYLTGGPTMTDFGLDASIFAAARTALTGAGLRAFGGVANGTDHFWMGSTNVVANTLIRLGLATTASESTAQAASYWTGSRRSATDLTLYKLAASVATNATNTTNTGATDRASWFAENVAGAFGAFASSRLSGGAFGRGLSSQNVADLVEAWTAFDAALTR